MRRAADSSDTMRAMRLTMSIAPPSLSGLCAASGELNDSFAIAMARARWEGAS
jgi:hypothetical protein